MDRIIFLIFFCVLQTISSIEVAAREVVPFNSPRWKIRGDSAAEEEYLGKKCLRLNNGSALLQDAHFTNGVIEFDLALTPGRYFPGIGFRMQDEGNGELYYLRPHQSGNPDAMQYYPEYNGDGGWQLYYGTGFNNAHVLPFDRWMHIKLLIKESRAEVYFDEEKEPVLYISKLRRPLAAGMIRLDNTYPATARFANFSYTSTDAVVLVNAPVPDPALPANTVSEWQVSDPFDEGSIADRSSLAAVNTASLRWTSLKTDERGVADLSILAGSAPGKNTVFAKWVIQSGKDQSRKLSFGFSDRARVYCNGKLLYRGEDNFMSRDYRFLGTMGYFDAVRLDLKKGPNEIWIAMSEDMGGWGLEAKLEDEPRDMIPYGNNPPAGKYLAMKDSTRIYYEVYGSGRPVVLLHGGLYGDISEYEKLIPALAAHFQVIAIETRGHGKSEIGHTPMTYSMFSNDAYEIIRHLTADSVLLVGFSDGAVSALDLTLHHPERVRKLVFAGGNLSPQKYRPGVVDRLKKLTGASLEEEDPGFVKERKALMPQPERWDEFVEMLKDAWLHQESVSKSQLESVKCPVLVVGGDRDQYNSAESFIGIYRQLPHAKLAIIPGSDHIVFYRRPDLMEAIVMEFVE